MIDSFVFGRTGLGLLAAALLTHTASSDVLTLLQENASEAGSDPSITQDAPSSPESGSNPESDSEAGSDAPLGWNMMFERVDRGTYASLGYLHEFGADFGDGGSVAVDRAFGSVGTKVRFHPDVTGSVGLAWGGNLAWTVSGRNRINDPGLGPETDEQVMFF